RFGEHGGKGALAGGPRFLPGPRQIGVGGDAVTVSVAARQNGSSGRMALCGGTEGVWEIGALLRQGVDVRSDVGKSPGDAERIPTLSVRTDKQDIRLCCRIAHSLSPFRHRFSARMARIR